MARTVRGLKFSSEFHKAPYLTIVTQHISMRFIPIFPRCRYCKLRRRQDSSPHSSNINLNKLSHDLKKNVILYFNGLLIIFWRQTQKNHILRTQHQIQINIGGIAISNSKCEKRLGIHFDNKLTFAPRVRSLCKKASQKQCFC